LAELTGLDDEKAPLGVPGSGSRATVLVAELRRLARSAPWAICLITGVAAALRLAEIDDVTANPFYDAAVRSMSLSWHNFFFGAFDPGAILSVDKPPVDLWLQVASTKLLGWNQAALKLPEAIGGTLAIPLLYDAVRRAVGRPAGLGAALVLAVLPESVLTSRSDTMDSLMMLVVIGALWLTIYAATTGRRLRVILAGAALGLAFNVKLFEALIAAPALLVLYLLAAPISWRSRLVNVLLWAAGLVTVGLSWAVAVTLAPGRHPYPIGSTDGTVWNVMFVFNGFGRVSTTLPRKNPDPAAPLRLVKSTPAHLDQLVGSVLIAALAIGVAALIVTLLRRRTDPRGRRSILGRAFAVALAVWLLCGVVLFSHVSMLHVRYLEALAPALAAVIGYGAAVLAGLGEPEESPAPPSVPGISLALACVCAYTFGLQPSSIAWGGVAVATVAVGAALCARTGGRTGRWARGLSASLIVATAVLYPIHKSLSLVRAGSSDSTGLRVYSPRTESVLSTYLGRMTAGIRYELAVDEPLALAPLIVYDQRPILPLTSFAGIPAVGLSALRAAVQSGAVRYALVGSHTCSPVGDRHAECVPAAQWIRRNGIDVTSTAGIDSGQRLYLLLPF